MTPAEKHPVAALAYELATLLVGTLCLLYLHQHPNADVARAYLAGGIVTCVGWGLVLGREGRRGSELGFLMLFAVWPVPAIGLTVHATRKAIGNV